MHSVAYWRVVLQKVVYNLQGGRVQLEFAKLVRSGLKESVRGRHRGSERALTAEEALTRMEAELAPLLMPNMVMRESVAGNGGWLENCGITLAINEMLVAANPTTQPAVPWLLVRDPPTHPLALLSSDPIRFPTMIVRLSDFLVVLQELFPGWPVSEPASFQSLATKGGFAVSASYPGPAGITSPVTVVSRAGEVCAVLDPWMGGPGTIVVSVSGGAPVLVTWVAVNSGHAVSFKTAANQTYTIARR